MRYIVPTVIDDTMLLSSSVPETDHPAWAAATAYAVGSRVIRTATHSIYERLVAGTTATPPEADAVNWLRVGPTNRWAMLDGAVGTATRATDTITVLIAPGIVRGLALLDLDAETVTVVMTAGGDEVYRREVSALATQELPTNAYDYCFGSILRRRLLVLTDLPPYSEGQITVTLSGAGAIGIGSLVVGPMHELGMLLSTPTVGIIDYSRKVTDDFGAVTIAERGYAKRVSATVLLPTATVDTATARLARIRATPVVWIGSASFDALVVYGFAKDWSIAIPGLINSTCALEIEGLV